MKKRLSQAFGKAVYLLGTDEYDMYIWLEAPSWDCKWYWGFGYVEEYTNHMHPNKSKDIVSHTHWDSIHKDGNNPFKETTFTKEEYAELKQLFGMFYQLRKEADSYHRNNVEEWNRLNQIEIPQITNRIIKILSPQ